MKLLSAPVAFAVAAAAMVGPVQAQVYSSPAPANSGYYRNAYPSYAYAAPAPDSYAAPTPEDGYRQGLINRWDLERLAGPLPQALQGPAVNSDHGANGGRE